jgi:hypothetical protein
MTDALSERKPRIACLGALELVVLPQSRRTSPVIGSAPLTPKAPLMLARAATAAGAERQNFLEHLPRYRDLGHLEGLN